MPVRKRAALDSGDSSEDEINVDRVVGTKKELDKIRKERKEKRAQLQTSLDKKLNNLRTRIKKTVDAHIKFLGDMHQQKLRRLLQAIEARERIVHVIVKEKLAEVQVEGVNLSTQLNCAYGWGVDKGISLAKPAAQVRQQAQTQESKKLKMDISAADGVATHNSAMRA